MDHSQPQTTRSRRPWLLFCLALLTMLSPNVSAFAAPRARYYGGKGIGKQVLDRSLADMAWEATNDMVLVERLPQDQEAAEGELFIPGDDLPKLHVCRVVSVGPGVAMGNGEMTPDLNQLQPGDVVVAKNPWGIGPKDEELLDGTKISYMRSIDIAAKVTSNSP